MCCINFFRQPKVPIAAKQDNPPNGVIFLKTGAILLFAATFIVFVILRSGIVKNGFALKLYFQSNTLFKATLIGVPCC